jgi:WD40 repeat protein
LAWVGGKVGGIIDLDTDVRSGATTGGQLVTWSPDGKTLAIGKGSDLRIYAADGKLLHTDATNQFCRSLAFDGNAKDGSTSILWNGERLYDARTGKETSRFDMTYEKSKYWNGLGVFSPDGLSVACAGESLACWLFIRDVKTGKVRRAFVQKPWFTGGSGYVSGQWGADGKPVGWRPSWATKSKDFELNTGTFRLDRLELGKTLAENERGPVETLKQGNLELKSDNPQTHYVEKDGKRVGDAIKGTFPRFAGEGRVAVVLTYNTWNPAIFDANTGKRLRRLVNSSPLSFGPRICASPDGRYLMGIQSNQTLPIWNHEQETPLLTLYKNGSDWVIWTQEGYYAATPGGEKMVSWRIDNGIDKMPTVLTVDRVGKRFLRPDVIKKTFELGSVKAALEALDGRAAKVERVEDSLPPKVELEVVKRDGKNVTIKVTAKARAKGQPVVALRLMLDGLPFPGLAAKRFSPPAAEAEWTETVEIPQGRHKLWALAKSEDASSRCELVDLEWGGRRACRRCTCWPSASTSTAWASPP